MLKRWCTYKRTKKTSLFSRSCVPKYESELKDFRGPGFRQTECSWEMPDVRSTSSVDQPLDSMHLNRTLISFNATSLTSFNATSSKNQNMASNFGLALLILGGGAVLVMVVCFFIDLLMVYICCVAESPLRNYHEEQARHPSGKKKKKRPKRRNSRNEVGQITALWWKQDLVFSRWL